MSGWSVMAGPLGLAGTVALVTLVVTVAVGLGRRPRSNDDALEARSARPGTRRVTDVEIVSAYNDALLSGWPAGEPTTFACVAGLVGTSADHVKAVIARHWQRES